MRRAVELYIEMRALRFGQMKGLQMITVIQDITLSDGTGGALIEDAVIAIREGKVLYAGSSGGSRRSGQRMILLKIKD